MKRLQIAINTRHWIPDAMEGIGRYVMNLADRISKAHPDADFHFIFDRKVKFNHDFAKNVSIHTIYPPARHIYVYPYWYNIAIPILLKKIKADIFLSLDCQYPLRSPIPGITAIHDINFEHYPQDIPSIYSKYLKKNTPKYIQKADKIITVSEFSKNDIISFYNADANKFCVVYNGISPHFYLRRNDEIQSIRKQFSAGNPYFLVLGSINPRKNIKRTIEAYTIFRNKNTCNYPLVISGKPMWKNSDLGSFIESNPYKADILFTGYLHDSMLGQVVGGAYALLFMSYFEGFGVPIIEAFASGVPVIAGNKTSIPEVAGGAALLTNPFDVNEMAETIYKLYSDNNLRQELIDKGIERSKAFSWNTGAEKLWEIILETLNNNSKKE